MISSQAPGRLCSQRTSTLRAPLLLSRRAGITCSLGSSSSTQTATQLRTQQRSAEAQPRQEEAPSSALRAAACALPVAAGILLALTHPALAEAAAAVPLAEVASTAAAAEFDPALAHTLEVILRPTFSIATLLYLVRVPMSWYPQIDIKKMPWVIATLPTEPVLSITRKAIGLVGGVDVTPLIWVGLLSFFSEILLGSQGLLMLAQRGQ